MPKRRLVMLNARAGRIVRGKFVPLKGGRRNIAEGFYDKQGVFHPIRHSPDYDPSRGDTRRAGGKKRKKTKAKKAKPKRKASPKSKKKTARKKSKAGRR